MNPAIESIHDRMKEGGDWKAFRDEISALHTQAVTEREFVTLLEAHANLVAVGEYAFDAETYSKILPAARAEYLTFLNFEAMEGGDTINPMMLDRITAREVAAGRLAPDDSFREFANAAGTVLGDAAPLSVPHARPGNWLFVGMSAAGVILWLTRFAGLDLSPLWMIPIGCLAGWFANDKEQRKIKKEVEQRRAERA
jgi:hypothetical protein